MNNTWHLLLERKTVPAGKEWTLSGAGWHFARLVEGAAYWLGGPETRSLVEGDLIVIAPRASGIIRASQLSDILFYTFSVCPERLCGLLTPGERLFFAEASRKSQRTVRFFSGAHPIAGQAASLANPGHRTQGLSDRLQMIGVLAAVFGEELAYHQPTAPPKTPAQHRFQELIARMPEIELMHHSPDELARECGCTVRHFSRLFRRHFGEAPRARQTEMRLLTAGQLLAETESKVIDVAFESGYRNLSLFNALFKRRYGVTPSEWRRKHASAGKRMGRAAAVAALLLAAFCPVPHWAAETNSPPAKAGAATNAPMVFEVKGYELIGNTLLPARVTDPILRKHTGLAVGFDDIRQALADLQMAYRERGFISVAVALPKQQLTNGLVRLQVTEGRLAEITIRDNRYFSSNNIRSVLPSLQTNTILNSLVFQQELDRANRNRDRQIYPVINPGPEPGTSALELKINDRLPLHGRFELDNYSTPQTPELRLNTSAQYNNLWQLEHQFGVQYSFSPEDYKQGSSFPLYDVPLITSYSAFYRVPLAPVNGPPRDQEYQLSEFGYDEVTHRFRPPPISDTSELLFYASRSSVDTSRRLQSETLTPPTVPPEGALQVQDQIFSRALTVNENLGARWSLPLPEFFKVRSSFSAGPDFKNFRVGTSQDRTFQATVYVPQVGQTGPPFSEFPSPPTFSSREVLNSLQYLPLTLLWEGDRTDKWGATGFTVSQSFNCGGLLGSPDDFRAVAGSAKADGNYYIVSAGATREQKLPGDWGLRLHADGQWANQPLISNEQFALGGLAGVRGYRDGEEYGDTGWRVQFEPHTPSLTVGVLNGKLPITARVFTFVDYGERYLLDPATRRASVEMLGLGGGIESNIGSHVEFRLVVGVPALDVPGRNSGDARANFALSAQF